MTLCYVRGSLYPTCSVNLNKNSERVLSNIEEFQSGCHFTQHAHLDSLENLEWFISGLLSSGQVTEHDQKPRHLPQKEGKSIKRFQSSTWFNSIIWNGFSFILGCVSKEQVHHGVTFSVYTRQFVLPFCCTPLLASHIQADCLAPILVGIAQHSIQLLLYEMRKFRRQTAAYK